VKGSQKNKLNYNIQAHPIETAIKEGGQDMNVVCLNNIISTSLNSNNTNAPKTLSTWSHSSKKSTLPSQTNKR